MTNRRERFCVPDVDTPDFDLRRAIAARFLLVNFTESIVPPAQDCTILRRCASSPSR
jgi:hypothetical protein